MDSKELEELLVKYWDCETSLEEEQQLKEFFSGPNVPDEHQSLKGLFHYYDQEKSIEGLDESFDQEVIAKLGNTKEGKPKGRIVRMFYDMAKVAAVLIIVATAGYYLNQEYQKTKNTPYLVDTFEDPKAAFEETKRALMMISKNFKKGKKEASKISTFHDAKEKVKDRKNEL